MVIKSKIIIKCNAKEFDSRDFCKNSISNSIVNWIFLVGDYHIWIFTAVERKFVGREPVINTYQLSVKYKRKSTGLHTEPCETSNVMFDIEELQLLIETYCFLLLK